MFKSLEVKRLKTGVFNNVYNNAFGYENITAEIFNKCSQITVVKVISVRDCFISELELNDTCIEG